MREENCVQNNACECAETCVNNGMCCSMCRRNTKLIDHYHKVKTYNDDFFEKFPNAYRCATGDPMPSLGSVHKVSFEKLAEYGLIADAERWDKPLGYWEGKGND